MIRITMQNGKTIDIELDHSAASASCSFWASASARSLPLVVK